MIVEFTDEMYRWQARSDADWYFVAMPEDPSSDVAELQGPSRRGFGAVRVHATVGSSSWRTSIFPGGDGRYVLPLKRAVREAENLREGAPVTVTLEIAGL
ncbi:uncharacterized protein DUF1905 [Microbacterium sp. AG1240]|uniref:DUF1905 domain-containing protein n=1 Tax=Microbacterium sp. AG1240 TaxID=2183992 RepID=UPI000EAC5CB1|nr:DUF1905 domain-containing protein [Microbacterium sp. AG1240]RKT31127.1 uncharacterized protein DUF1905 [Microbacterium sp. AG1240]